MMKKSYLITAIVFLLSLVSYAQGEDFREKKEQIKAFKVAFITDELKLTTSEAEKFWPLYNAYDSKQQNLRHQKFKSLKENDINIDKMSDKEATAYLTQMESNEEEVFQNRKKFVASLKGVIPPQKIIKLKKAEEDFNRKLLKQYRDKFKK